MTRRLFSFVCLTIVAACGWDAPSGAKPETSTPAPTISTTPQDEQLHILDGTEWIVTMVGDEPVAEGFVARLRFVNVNEIGGEIACDGLYLEYEIDGTRISPTIELQRTHFDCSPEEDPKDQREQVFEALQRMDSFTATESKLDLFDENGDLLLALERFLPPPLDPALEGDWVVIELKGEPPLAGSRLSLNISYESVGGFSGCNQFGGVRSPLADNALDIEALASTAMACPEPPGLQDQEAAYQSAVGDADSYLVDENTLSLLDAGGSVLVKFEREPDVPMDPADLVGTAWRLVSIGGKEPPPDAGVTLVFEDDEIIRGFAGCRGYEGVYRAEEDDIRFPELGMTSTACERSDAYRSLEQDFIEALGNAIRYRIDGDSLQIMTMQGETLEFARDER